MTSDIQLTRNAFGRLVLTLPDGSTHGGVVPVRAFPLSAPDAGIALVNESGHELAWIASLAELPASTRALIEAELAERDFMPVIERLIAVSTFATPSQWTVTTDRGQTTFTLKSEDDIRRLADNALLISDHHGVHYLVRDLTALDRHSRRLLDRFL